MSSMLEDQIKQFLSATQFADAQFQPIAGDASTRSYRRAKAQGKQAVLLIAPPGAEAPDCPRDASPAERQRLGYNACARLAGPNLHAFSAVAKMLRDAGMSAPEIYAEDAVTGLALIEDLGDGLYVREAVGEREEPLYHAAVMALVHLHQQAPAPPNNDDYAMLSYDETALGAEVELLTQWYWELKTGAPPSDDFKAEFRGLFDEAIARLSRPSAIVLRDFHAENLLWLPEREGVRRVGVIDFQDGLVGHSAYDLVSLLEDARRDVDEALQQKMVAAYLNSARERIDGFDADQFADDYAILAAQRNAKILGIFARLYVRDKKERYLDFLPRVEAHFAKDLRRHGLEKLNAFVTAHLPVSP